MKSRNRRARRFSDPNVEFRLCRHGASYRRPKHLFTAPFLAEKASAEAQRWNLTSNVTSDGNHWLITFRDPNLKNPFRKQRISKSRGFIRPWHGKLYRFKKSLLSDADLLDIVQKLHDETGWTFSLNHSDPNFHLVTLLEKRLMEPRPKYHFPSPGGPLEAS